MIEVFKKHQKRSILLLISFVVVLVLFKESYAILTVKLVVNPDKTVVPVGSDPITLTAKASGSNLKFEWKLLGPGKIEGFITGPAVFYIPPEKIDSKAVDVIITLKVTDAKGQEVTENLILTIASNGADVPTITPTPVPTRAPRPTPEKEDKLEQLKLEFCKERLPQLLQQTLCQHYEKYQKLKKKVQQEDNTINQTILVFKDIVGNLKESKTCVETITREDPESPLKDFIPRLKKILDRSKKIENSQQTLVLGDFTFIPLRCQPIASIDEQLPVIDNTWKETDAYKGPEASPYESPTQILVDEEENFYVLDRLLKRIFKFDSKGNHVPCRFDEMAAEKGWAPISMAMSYGSSKTLWVYESWQGEENVSPPPTGRIRIYTKDGTQAVGWNGKEELTACEEVSFPLKGLIALDIENNLIIVDQESGVMTKCDNYGKLLNQWGHYEKITPLGKEEIINPFEIVTDPQGLVVDLFGYIYVSNTAGHGIQRYYPDGEWIPGWPNVRGKNLFFFDSPHGLAVDEKSYVYVSDTRNHRIKKYTSGGEELLWYLGKKNTQKGGKYGEFNNPMGVAVNSNGTIVYVADTGNKRVQKFLIQKYSFSEK